MRQLIVGMTLAMLIHILLILAVPGGRTSSFCIWQCVLGGCARS